MGSSKILRVLIKLLFTFIGFLSLFKIIQNYGIHALTEEIHKIGYAFLLLIFTFLPTAFCYSLSWLMLTKHKSMRGKQSSLRKIYLFTKITIASIAWNNLTPFLKIGGEPIKYMMLSNYLPKKEALSSTVNYNIIHLLSTALSFGITSLLLIFFFNTKRHVYNYLIFFTIFISFFLILSWWIFQRKNIDIGFKYKYRLVRTIIINVKFAFRKLRLFYKKYPHLFFLSLFFDILARFLEGVTFYFGFYFIKHPISLLSSSLLDIGRTFADTIFFFIPYQVGSREEGVHYFMVNILNIDSKGFLSAVIIYRLVEIFWIIVGYIIWVSGKSSVKEVMLKSAKVR